MKLLKQVEKIAKKMKWYDFSMLKLSVFFFTLFLVLEPGQFLVADTSITKILHSRYSVGCDQNVFKLIHLTTPHEACANCN